MIRILSRIGLRGGMMGVRSGMRLVSPGTRFTLSSLLRTFFPGIPGSGGGVRLNVKLKGVESLLRTLETEGRRQQKAVDIAVKHEGVRLMRLLKDEIKAGTPGGRRFHSLTYLSRTWGAKGLRPNKPLRKLAAGVRFHIPSKDPFDMRIGWVGPKVSKSSKRIVKLQQEGFDRSMPAQRRLFFIRKAGGLGKRSVARRYLFLRKDTKSFRTPARPIMEPFWNTHKDKAWRNIQRNYRRKMRGEYI